MDGNMRPIGKDVDFWGGARFAKQRVSRGMYESWFLRANHPSKPRAFWIRYTVFESGDIDVPPEGELWACYFDGDKGETSQTVTRVPISKCFFSPDELRVIIDNSALSGKLAKGACHTPKHKISWQLEMRDGQSPFLMLPRKFYDGKFPKAKSLVLSPNMVCNGRISVDGTDVNIANWRGSINHNWGVQHTDRYHWGQVAGFDNAPDAFLEVASAAVDLSRIISFEFTPLVLRVDGRQYDINSLTRSFLAHSQFGTSFWSFETSNQDIRIRGKFEAEKENFAAFRYRNPPGGEKLCLNTKIARCELWLEFKSGETQNLVSASGGAWEILRDFS